MKELTLADIPKKKKAPHKKKAKDATKKKRAPSAWVLHIKKTQEELGCTYKEAMKAASKTYVKPKKTQPEKKTTTAAAATEQDAETKEEA